ncbi:MULTISPECIES: Mpo1 family 2-hydroxy fatty acid dioxygenase [unclassified Pseudoalteromonas]|uniref:Mpo1 family 2-hydroxy fatty acid dioxygenase n=1 Tax=unclassified Pseudoalteromonas TaxID=194690 RepID=UPI000C798B70|nr:MULTISPECIES: Mpo1-like protein [unclassified Pseudoalteromonas]AUJ72805.1 hypothetical protein PNC201_22945 [Pseudoalteromonas sp. NC201]MCF7515132.1 DUF962 domain-containing protein [Pseudoalteromonas sp. L7]MCF7527338.1 DUF962 domain-containing protein [Pseudoalteromonas sp. L23]MCX2768978.1 DUF962 domain-containing protein [Pseudoalteromonas sp. B530]
MNKLETLLSQYAMYHRSKRNILTHFFGIPLIVIAVVGMTFIPLFSVSGVTITLAALIGVVLCGYYLMLSPIFGLMMSAIILAFYFLVQTLSPLIVNAGIMTVLFWAGVFFVGWVLQFIGHYFEGKKPAFVDDLIGLAIGPLFVLVELLFVLGLCKELESKIVNNAGEYKA